jgi:hypothetical protein
MSGVDTFSYPCFPMLGQNGRCCVSIQLLTEGVFVDDIVIIGLDEEGGCYPWLQWCE